MKIIINTLYAAFSRFDALNRWFADLVPSFQECDCMEYDCMPEEACCCPCCCC